MNRFKMFLEFYFFRISMITNGAPVQLFLQMNQFNMLLQIDFLACFVTSCPHGNNLFVFQKCIFQKNLSHKFGTYVTYLLNEQIQNVFKIPFFENKNDHIQSCFVTFSIDELVRYALSNRHFLKNHSHNSSMFCDILS